MRACVPACVRACLPAYKSFSITDSSRSSASRGKVECWRGIEDDCSRCEYLLRRADGQTAACGKVNTHNQIIIIYIRI